MNFKRLLLIFLIALWVFEPFLSLAMPMKASKPSVCSTCGMKDKCGAVCCCANAKTVDPGCYRHAPGLYAPGCSPGESAAHFLSQTTAKWFPTSQPWITPIPVDRSFIFISASIPVPSVDLFSPPPEAGFLS